MKNAIIGLGSIGKVHTRVVRELFGEPSAVCDVDASRFDGYDGIPQYSDYKLMLDEICPDVVHICTPHYLHAEMIIECLKRDINVLCEKPMCIKNDEIDAILEAEKNSKAKLGICLQNRYNASNAYVKDYLANKNIVAANGNVIWHRGVSYYRSGDWRGKWDTEGGGVLINQALHTLDLMQWIVGMPNKVTANIANMTLKGEIEVEDSAFAIYSGASSFVFFATLGSQKDFDVEINIRTDSEKIKVLPNSVVVNGETVTFTTDDTVYGKLCYGSGHKRLIADFYDCTLNGKDFSINGSEGAKVVKLILSAYRSQGNTIDI